MKLYYRALAIGVFFCVFFSYLATVSLNRGGPILPSTQVSSFSFIFLILIVLVINPLLKWFKFSPLNAKELVLIATMAIVPAGVAGFGFVTEFIPFVGSLYNPKWTAKYEENIIPNNRPELYVKFKDAEGNLDPKGFDTYNEGQRIRGKEAFPVLFPKEGRLSEYPSDIAKYFFKGNPDKRKFWGDIPWQEWLTPLLLWSLFFGIVIVMFFALNEMIFKQWYENEKLVFPHAELICSMLGVGEENRIIPSIYKHKGFWFGFTISFSIMLYNGMAAADWLPGLSPIDLRGNMDNHLKGTWLAAAMPFQFTVFFAVIGLAFLLPAEISFSVWFFFLFLVLQKLIAVQTGYVPSAKALNPEWISGTTFITSQGGGAMIVFAVACLWKIRHNMVAFIYRFIYPEGKGRITIEDIKSQTGPSLTFFLSSIAFILFMMWAKVSFGMALVVYFMVVVITVTCMRLVSESGLLSFQLFFGPFHLIKNFGLLSFTRWFNLQSLAAAIPLFGSLFLDLKTFMAAAMSTCRALAEKVKIEKGNFPLSLALAFAFSLVISIIVSLALVYDLGVNSMQGWFYLRFPNSNLFPNINAFAMNIERFQAVSYEHVGWTTCGGIMMSAVLLIRRVFFWFPHPIGLILLLNPVAQRWWFSFFIAWFCKTLAVKYCKPDTYRDMKLVFMGLFIGELVIVAIAAIVLLFGFGSMDVSMNR